MFACAFVLGRQLIRLAFIIIRLIAVSPDTLFFTGDHEIDVFFEYPVTIRQVVSVVVSAGYAIFDHCILHLVQSGYQLSSENFLFIDCFRVHPSRCNGRSQGD